MGYDIKVLSSDEFDKLPYDGIGDSLGFADVKRGKVYVRHTGSHELNRYLINHEIDHLVEKHATDEDEHGIRHKKFKDFLRVFYNPLNIPGMGPLSNKDKGLFQTDNQSSLKNEAAMGIEGGGMQPQFSQPEGGPTGPFAQFSTGQQASGNLPSNIGGSVSGTLNTQGLGGGTQQVSPEMIQRIKGYYGGRMTF